MLNPLSTDALVAWLERKDPNDHYNYGDSQGCLLFQYLANVGLPVCSVRPDVWRDMYDVVHWLPPGWDAIASPSVDDDDDEFGTFGSALKRAREQLDSEQRVLEEVAGDGRTVERRIAYADQAGDGANHGALSRIGDGTGDQSPRCSYQGWGLVRVSDC